MKKHIIIIAIMIMSVGIAPKLFAQSTTPPNITANATVVATLSYSNAQNINFGNVDATSTPVLDPVAGTETGYNSGTPSVGKLTITGTPGASINLVWNAGATSGTSTSGAVTLEATTTSGGTTTNSYMDFVPKIIGDVASSPSSGSKNLTGAVTGSAITVTLGASGTTNPGIYNIWIGGALGAEGSTTAGLSNQAPGTYSNTLTITATYN